MKQNAFPIWFRAYVFIPVLGLLYAVIPLYVWNFSPHALTHTTPVFLLGATDWGTGNIYTFTKMAYWIGLVSGTIANGKVFSDKKELTGLFLQKCRLNAWHFGAAISIPLLNSPGGINTDSIDMWLLFAYFVCSASLILWLQAITHLKGRRRFAAFSFLIAIVWGFIPVALGRP